MIEIRRIGKSPNHIHIRHRHAGGVNQARSRLVSAGRAVDRTRNDAAPSGTSTSSKALIEEKDRCDRRSKLLFLVPFAIISAPDPVR